MLDLERVHTGSLVSEPISITADPGSVIAALARRDGAVMLDSSAAHDSWGRYTIAACRPLCVVSLSDGVCEVSSPAEAAGRRIRTRRRGESVPGAVSLTSLLRRVLGCAAADGPADEGYAPGWMGYLGYEMGRYFECLPGRVGRDTGLPEMHLAFYDAVLVYDALTGQWRLVSFVFDDPPPGAGEAGRELLEVLNEAATVAPPASSPSALQADPFADGVWTSTFEPDAYRRAVARCVGYIAAGDIFQVNLSQRFTRPFEAAPSEMYRILRRMNPAAYSGYLSPPACAGGGDWTLLSSSPELFLRVRGRRVITRPIKGTCRRTGDEAADRRAAAALAASAKDNAELAMIVDLLRNDLGRVCRYGSVRVTDRQAVETHPTVFHLVGTVVGDLHDNRDLADLIGASFPGGSITGAPKIRAMEIIDELEPVARGPYTGSLAHFGVDGGAELSIIIRTAVCDGRRIHMHAGGGIVADSTPDGEYVETLDKARAVLAAIDAADAAGVAACASPNMEGR